MVRFSKLTSVGKCDSGAFDVPQRSFIVKADRSVVRDRWTCDLLY